MTILRWATVLAWAWKAAPLHAFVPPPEAVNVEEVSEVSVAMQDLLNNDKSELEALLGPLGEVRRDAPPAIVQFVERSKPRISQRGSPRGDVQNTAAGMAAAVAAMEASNELDALSLKTRAASERVVGQAPLSDRGRAAASRVVALSQARARAEQSERAKLQSRIAAARANSAERESVRRRLEARIVEVQRKLLEAQRKEYDMSHQVRIAEQAIRNSGGVLPPSITRGVGAYGASGYNPGAVVPLAALALSQGTKQAAFVPGLFARVLGRDEATGEVPVWRFAVFVLGLVAVVLAIIWTCTRLFKGRDTSVKLSGGKNAVPTRVKGAQDMCEDWVHTPSKTDKKQSKEEERLRGKMNNMNAPGRRQPRRANSPRGGDSPGGSQRQRAATPSSFAGTHSSNSSTRQTPRSKTSDLEAAPQSGYRDDEDH